MNKIPDCKYCERCKGNQQFFDEIYCCDENEPLQIFGLLGVYFPPENSPKWCPKRKEEYCD